LPVPNPIVERDNRREREGFVEYMLASLIGGSKPPGWNKPFIPSDRGIIFLKKLDTMCFGHAEWKDPPQFYWEFILPQKAKDKKTRWPDLAATWDNRVLLFELKIEPGSIREGQVDEYIDLALSCYPDRQIDMIYITSDAVAGKPQVKPSCSYINITWEMVIPLIASVWNSNHKDFFEAAVANVFADYLAQTCPDKEKIVSPVRTPSNNSPAIFSEKISLGGNLNMNYEDSALGSVIPVALAVEKTGKQGVLNVPVNSLSDGKRLIDEVKNKIRMHNRTGQPYIKHVLPWVWNEKTSGGKGVLKEGKNTGYEIRLSYFKDGNGL
jgi:hypothetical protein